MEGQEPGPVQAERRDGFSLIKPDLLEALAELTHGLDSYPEGSTSGPLRDPGPWALRV